MLEHWIWLATRQGLDKRKQYELQQRFGDPESLYHATGEMLSDSLNDKSLEEAYEILNRCRERDVQLLTVTDPRYPGRLRGIYDPPILLYYRGNLPDWDAKPIVGAVGTRSSSSYGIRCAQRMGDQLTRCGALVVSGMAEGIDAAILEGVLSAGGTPAVFLAGGVDVIYPAANRELYDTVLACGGCILSEQPPGVKSAKWLFSPRNRLISGISNGVLVVEAPERSGALITARHGLEQGREVYVVPGPIDAESCRGSNGLLREGAQIAQSGWDILQSWQADFEGLADRTAGNPVPLKNDVEPAHSGRKPHAIRSPEKKVIDNSQKRLYIDGVKKPAVGSPREQAIVDQLLDGPMPIDAVINGCGIPRGEALAVMTLLEVRKVVRRLPGDLMALNE